MTSIEQARFTITTTIVCLTVIFLATTSASLILLPASPFNGIEIQETGITFILIGLTAAIGYLLIRTNLNHTS